MSLDNLSSHIRSTLSHLTSHKTPLLTLLLLPLFPLAYHDYRGWLALGPGGLPHNPLGWLIQSLLRIPSSRNVRDATPYDKEISNSELEKTSFLEGRLPAYGEKSPKTGKWVVPHRQLEGGASADINKVCILFLFLLTTRIHVLDMLCTTRSHKSPSILK